MDLVRVSESFTTSNAATTIVKAFTYEDRSFDVNIVGTMDEPLFQANQIGDLLGFGNIRSTVASLDDDMKAVVLMDTPGGQQPATFLTEAGLYMLLFRSRVPLAKEFRRWACNVLKQMRLDLMGNQRIEIEKISMYERERERERVYAAQEAEKADVHAKEMATLKIRQLELERDMNKDEVPDISGFTFREIDLKSKTHPFRTSYAVTMQFLSCGQYKIDLAPQQMALLDKFKYDLAAWSRLSWSSFEKSAVELAVAQVGARWDIPFKVIHGLVRRGGKSTARLPLL